MRSLICGRRLSIIANRDGPRRLFRARQQRKLRGPLNTGPSHELNEYYNVTELCTKGRCLIEEMKKMKADAKAYSFCKKLK